MRFILDRYLLLEWLKIFILSLFVTVGLLLIEDIYDNLPDLIGEGASAKQIALYYVGLIPSFLPAIIPLSLMVSLLFVLGNLHRNGEVIALRAAGLSLFQITRVLFVAGIVISAVLFYLNAAWVPWSIEHSRNFVNNLRFAKTSNTLGQAEAIASGLISPFTYANPQTHHLWVMEGFSELTNQGFGVNFYERSSSGHLHRQLIAQEAFFDDSGDYWVFLKGRETNFNEKGEPTYSAYFDRLSTPEYKDDPTVMLLTSQEPQDLSALELRRLLEGNTLSPSKELRPYAVAYQSILSSPLIALIVVCLAIPLAVSGVRVSPIVGVSKCVGLFFVYYFIDSICSLLGGQGHLPILLAVWLPGLLMLALAGYLYKKAA